MGKIFAFIFLMFISMGNLFSNESFYENSKLSKNAYVFFDKFNNEYKMCLIHEGHYYLCEMPKHYVLCPCVH